MASPPPPLPDAFKPGATIAGGRYRLIKKLRAGGNGVVWLANHTAMGADIVIKFPLRWVAGSRAADEQLEREVQSLVAYSSRHPHIINILDVGEESGRRFVVTQLMHNGSLQQFCPLANHMPHEHAAKLIERLSWLKEISGALDFVHEAGLIHRDVKPANVLLDDSFSAYLADFGIAIGDEPHASAGAPRPEPENSLVGSLPYIAPELLTGSPATAASDQFALGVTFFEFVLGSVPFPGTSGSEVHEAQHKMIPRWANDNSISGFNPLVGRVLRRALSMNPAQRYPNCSQFADALIAVWKAPPKSPRHGPTERSTDTKHDLPSAVRTEAVQDRPTPRKPSPPLPTPKPAPRKIRIDRLLDDDRAGQS